MSNNDRVAVALKQYRNPHRLHLETTNHCNLRCEHCYRESNSKNKHYDSATIFRVLDELYQKGVKEVTLTGGEILSRPDWKKIIMYALDRCHNVSFITNGALLTREKLAWLAHEKAVRSFKNFWKTFF